jgi:hypothetical protein
MIDNFKLIKPRLEFPNDDIYYHLQILRRGKDHPELPAANRVIKSYFICSLESLDYVEDEIKKLCEFFGARAYINLAPKSIKKTTMLQLKYLAQRAYEGDFKKIWKSWNTCAGEIKGEEARWIVDIDNLIPREDILKITNIDERGKKFAYNHNIVTSIESFINENCDPLERDYGGYLIYKTLYPIETKSGVHIITKPFNLQQFKEKYPDIDVHKNNPTLLYCL